jgi:hypothetical protein
MDSLQNLLTESCPGKLEILANFSVDNIFLNHYLFFAHPITWIVLSQVFLPGGIDAGQ